MSPAVGLVEWFETGDTDRVERVVRGMRELGIEHLRTGVSWAGWHAAGGERWYDWLLPRLAREVTLLPCVVYTPPSLGVVARSSSPPRRTRDYADFLDFLITRHGEHFEHVELWNEPNNLVEWDWRLDLEWNRFAEMIVDAAYWAQQRGKKTVLGGMSPFDKNWLALMAKKGALENIDVVGIHGFPGTWEVSWEGWRHLVESVHDVLGERGLSAEVWITESGYSTWKCDEFAQVQVFLSALAAPVARVYWYSAEDLPADRAASVGFQIDVRQYHAGIRRHDGTPKLLARLWGDGLDNVRTVASLGGPERVARAHAPLALVTGGAGFVGTNLAHRLLSEGMRVRILDNLSRPGVERNLAWLREAHPAGLSVELADLRERFALRRAVNDADRVFHLAGQVAVTAAVDRPEHDFDVNLRGTLTLLEELRRLPEPPPLLFASTNKVYGSLADLELLRNGERWEPLDAFVRESGIAEQRPLDFSTPYGCSKGGADQYVLDYAETYGLPAVVFRMSCVYGPHQHGTEDQGWVAHFLLQALRGHPITIFGDGAQVRDVLYVDDLVEAMLLATREARSLAGTAFNVGGGSANSLSLLELVDRIADLDGMRPDVVYADARAGDQRWYVSDTSRLAAATGWSPQVGAAAGVEALYRWLSDPQRATLKVPT